MMGGGGQLHGEALCTYRPYAMMSQKYAVLQTTTAKQYVKRTLVEVRYFTTTVSTIKYACSRTALVSKIAVDPTTFFATRETEFIQNISSLTKVYNVHCIYTLEPWDQQNGGPVGAYSEDYSMKWILSYM